MPEVIVKQSATSRTGTATMTADPDLVVSLEANTVYWVRINFRGIAGATNDFKYSLNFTGTMNYARIVAPNIQNQSPWNDNITVGNGACIGGAFTEVGIAANSSLTINGSGTASTHYGGTMAGLISVDTAGDLQFIWAQNTSGGNTATVEAGSSIFYFPITEMEEDFIIKSVNEDRDSTSTLADDSELVLNLEANKKYIVNLCAFYSATATPDFKYAVKITGSPTAIASGTIHREIAATTVLFGNTRGTFHTVPASVNVTGAGTAASNGATEYNMGVIMGGSPGVLSFQWAQQTSGATDVSVWAGSYIKYLEVP